MKNQGRLEDWFKKVGHKIRRGPLVSIPTTGFGKIGDFMPGMGEGTRYLREGVRTSEKKADQRKCDNILVDISKSASLTTDIIKGMEGEDTVFKVLEGFLDGLKNGIGDELTRLSKINVDRGIKSILIDLENRKIHIMNACNDVFNNFLGPNKTVKGIHGITEKRCSGMVNNNGQALNRQGSSTQIGPTLEWGFTKEKYIVTHPAPTGPAPGQEGHALHAGIGGIDSDLEVTNADYFKKVMGTKINLIIVQIEFWNGYIDNLFNAADAARRAIAANPARPAALEVGTRVDNLLPPPELPVDPGALASHEDTITYKYELLIQQIAEKTRGHIVNMFDSARFRENKKKYMIPNTTKKRLNYLLKSIDSVHSHTGAPIAAALGPTHGTYTGGQFVGHDFATNGPGDLEVVVGGVPQVITLTGDLTMVAEAAAEIDTLLNGATVSVALPPADEALVITSNATGTVSMVDLGPATSPNALQLFGGGGVAKDGTN